MIANTSLRLTGSCECGACSFELQTLPKARFRCHCLICQAFNEGPFADVVAVHGRNVSLTNEGHIAFKKYRSPPNFNRGLCRTCLKPVVEIAGFGPLKVMFIPAKNFKESARLVPASMDIFYHRRVRDMPEGLPKHSSYFASEMAVGKLIMRGL